MAKVQQRDIAKRGSGYCVEVEQKHGDWDHASGDACGWTLTGARKAMRSFARLLDTPARMRIRRERDGKVVARGEAHEHWRKR